MSKQVNSIIEEGTKRLMETCKPVRVEVPEEERKAALAKIVSAHPMAALRTIFYKAVAAGVVPKSWAGYNDVVRDAQHS